MADAKPSDFFLGVIHFFAILLPGAALVYLTYPLLFLIRPWAWKPIERHLPPSGSTESWIVFLMGAYIVGHFLNAVAGKLDFGYDNKYLKEHHPDHHRAAQIIKSDQLLEEKLRALKANGRVLIARVFEDVKEANLGTSLYNWCLSYIRLSNDQAAAEVDRYQADSKFFRSLVFVFAAGFLVALLNGWVAAAALAALLAYFSRRRFWSLRWDATKRVYEYYLLLRHQLTTRGDAGARAA